MKAQKRFMTGALVQIAISYFLIMAAVLPGVLSEQHLSAFDWLIRIFGGTYIPYSIYILLKTKTPNIRMVVFSVMLLTIMAILTFAMSVWLVPKILPVDTWLIFVIVSSLLVALLGIFVLILSRDIAPKN